MIWDVERGGNRGEVAEVAKQLEEMRAYLDPDQKRSQLAELEEEMASPGFGMTRKGARQGHRPGLKGLKDRLTDWDELSLRI